MAKVLLALFYSDLRRVQWAQFTLVHRIDQNGRAMKIAFSRTVFEFDWLFFDSFLSRLGGQFSYISVFADFVAINASFRKVRVTTASATIRAMAKVFLAIIKSHLLRVLWAQFTLGDRIGQNGPAMKIATMTF